MIKYSEKLVVFVLVVLMAMTLTFQMARGNIVFPDRYNPYGVVYQRVGYMDLKRGVISLNSVPEYFRGFWSKIGLINPNKDYYPGFSKKAGQYKQYVLKCLGRRVVGSPIIMHFRAAHQYDGNTGKEKNSGKVIYIDDFRYIDSNINKRCPKH